MSCEIEQCAGNDDRFLWQCYGSCGKKFHAACAGIQSLCVEQLRRFMLPLCFDCQEKFILENLQQRRNLTSSIETMMVANHKICSTLNSFNIHEALESLESQLNELRGELSGIKKISKSTATDLICRVSSLLNESPIADSIESSVQQANAVLSSALIQQLDKANKKVDNQIEQIRLDILDVDMAMKGKCTHAEIIEEIKSISPPATEILASINALSVAVSKSSVRFMEELQSFSVTLSKLEERRSPQCAQAHKLSMIPEISPNSIAAEQAHSTTLTNVTGKISGWRFVGTTKIWKNDWTEFDEKQKRRAAQQKIMDRAAKQRKKRRHVHNNNVNDDNYLHSSTNSNFILRRNEAMQHISKLPTLASRARENADLNTASDKELLAAAKVTFAGNTIASDMVSTFVPFKKGEILNPLQNAPTFTTAPISTTSTSVSSAHHDPAQLAVPASREPQLQQQYPATCVAQKQQQQQLQNQPALCAPQQHQQQQQLQQFLHAVSTASNAWNLCQQARPFSLCNQNF